MDIFYQKFFLFSICVVFIFGIFFFQRQELQVKCIPYSRDEYHLKVKKRKKYTRSRDTNFSVFCRLYFPTIKSHIYRACFCLYFLCCLNSSWSLSLGVAISIFTLSSLTIMLKAISAIFDIEAAKKISLWYGRLFFFCYQTIATMLVVSTIFVGLLEILHIQIKPTLNGIMMGIFSSMRVISREGEFLEVLKTESGLIIEENEEFYRITIAQMQWLIKKNDCWNKIIFAVLIHAAKQQGKDKHVTRLKSLVKAFEFKSQGYFLRFYQEYTKNNSLIEIMRQGIDLKFYKLKSRVLKLWCEDLQLSIEDIKCKLKQDGIEASIQEIEESIRHVNFLKLRYPILETHSRDRRSSAQQSVKMEFLQKRYRIWLGEFFWEVCSSKKSELMRLLGWFEEIRHPDGRQVIHPRDLQKMKQKAEQQLFEKLLPNEMLTRGFPPNYSAKRYALGEKILDMWLENISLTPKDIASRLIDRGEVQSISVETIYKLANQSVNFRKIRKHLLKDYRQGKYRRSTKWLIQCYRNIIDDLISKISKNQNWSKAKIEKYIEEIPSFLSPEKENKTIGKNYFTAAWLKCFLFNLPKSKQGKICCRSCGSFDTVRKTKLPQPHIITDAKTGKTTTAYSFRFSCRNPHCSVKTFTATGDGSHILHEPRYRKFCMIFRLIMDLGASYGSVARIFGVSKSVVFDNLTLISNMADYWKEILGVFRFSGTLCIDEKFVKVAQLKKKKGNRNFAYLFFAVDPQTYDLLHTQIYPSRDNQAVIAFLTALKSQGIYPKVIMTDLFSGYSSAIKEVYGRKVTIAKCHFHFQQNIFAHMNNQFGKKEIPEIAYLLQKDIFFVVGAKSKKTIKARYLELKELRNEYLRREDRLLPMFDCLDNYLPHLLRVIEHNEVQILTNNACELVIRRFNQRYKNMSGFDSLKTAQRHAKLFQIYHRFTPFTDDAAPKHRRKSPLQLAGYDLSDMPIFHYLTQPLLLNFQPKIDKQIFNKKSA